MGHHEEGVESPGTEWTGMHRTLRQPECTNPSMSLEGQKRGNAFSEQLSVRVVPLPSSSLLPHVNVTVSLMTGCGHVPVLLGSSPALGPPAL